MNKDSKKYYSELKLFFPVHGKIERQMFSDIRFRLEELNENIEKISYEQICEELGTPQEIVSGYFCDTDTEYLVKRLRFTQYIRRCIFILIAAIIIIAGVYGYHLHKLYLEISEKDTPTYLIETIEE